MGFARRLASFGLAVTAAIVTSQFLGPIQAALADTGWDVSLGH